MDSKGIDKMARLRAYKANGGEIVDLIEYKKQKESIKIKKEIRTQIDREIKKKSRTVTDAWDASMVALKVGKRTAIQKVCKAICYLS